jgi:hypothetical protein
VHPQNYNFYIEYLNNEYEIKNLALSLFYLEDHADKLPHRNTPVVPGWLPIDL